MPPAPCPPPLTPFSSPPPPPQDFCIKIVSTDSYGSSIRRDEEVSLQARLTSTLPPRSALMKARIGSTSIKLAKPGRGLGGGQP